MSINIICDNEECQAELEEPVPLTLEETDDKEDTYVYHFCTLKCLVNWSVKWLRELTVGVSH